ncbi:v-type proton atpase 16 kda proteolipid subunit [Anaeramoeba flamelloides]|uniref:V-type proton ATPase proteolipid subunit n=1 Tax=Anaeramoeba flamelloides TaxID=1746091 RepID=A0AAV7YGE5_9EUKA|nr:v-type proton atpase 16 kda proteolipid subunit [Anaeramoeba flamelloides]KAJ3438139.1 v-type proton atpase 16 kda proteolipid subunit [Anaeramoeba flamelloides]KAJ6238501.1 v-type proton atpase 16 kda proteolipid subunit [Anaeramoeba flamelloides]KAJ6240851.1 v-type proton atpase 16 kda proteolipid subunit [Anaeramoeba flamelloides]|eukprot:Anaeramoba_flamelloidesc41770_g1_i1.p1 GENE.c41770_g1_i1~~c41770_g1_i1.p1  ORF type:complete len:173 (+),score=12.86 c41770_g1_i1:22-540(+)
MEDIFTLTAEPECSVSSYFYGYFGCACALVLSAMGSAYGIARCGVGVASIGPFKPEVVMKSLVPSIMASIVGIYGLIVAVIIASTVTKNDYASYKGFAQLAAGLAVGLSGIAAGWSIGVVGEIGVVHAGHERKVFVAMVLVLIFAEALGIYGLIIGIVLSSKGTQVKCHAST